MEKQDTALISGRSYAMPTHLSFLPNPCCRGSKGMYNHASHVASYAYHDLEQAAQAVFLGCEFTQRHMSRLVIQQCLCGYLLRRGRMRWPPFSLHSRSRYK